MILHCKLHLFILVDGVDRELPVSILHCEEVRRRLHLGTEGWSLVVGVGDLLQEAVNLSQGESIVKSLQRTNVGSPIFSN